MNKKNIIKIIFSVILLVALIGVIIHLQNESQPKTEVDGSITVIVVDINGSEKYHKVIDYYKGDDFLSLLEKNFTIIAEDDAYGKLLYGIDDVITDFQTTYLAIYINDNYSNVGISYIELEDEMIVKFVETKI